MQRHHGNGGLNIRDRQVNEGALGELEAANAETGSLNGVCTLPVSQCGVFALYSSRTGLCCSLVLWWFWWLVCACKPCTQPSSQTLQSHEWRHSAYSPCKSAPQRSCGSGYKASSVARQARSLLPFNLLKVEPASHAVNTATSNLGQQFICMQKPSTYQIQSFNWSPRVSDFFVFL